MPLASLGSDLLRAAAFARDTFVARLRVARMPARATLVAAPFLPVLVHGPIGSEETAFGALTATVIPALAFAWALVWARGAEPRLRVLRVAFAERPRLAKGAVAASLALAGSLAFGSIAAVVAARAHAVPGDVLALFRIALASAFAWIGIALALAPRATALTFLVPLALATARTERGALYALVPNAQAYALTVDPPSGLEARARFAALLVCGALGIVAFALRGPQASRRRGALESAARERR